MSWPGLLHLLRLGRALTVSSTLLGPNCVRPCLLGDLYAVYGLYAIGKACMGTADVILCTGFLLRRPRDWYRARSATHARLTAGKL